MHDAGSRRRGCTEGCAELLRCRGLRIGGRGGGIGGSVGTLGKPSLGANVVTNGGLLAIGGSRGLLKGIHLRRLGAPAGRPTLRAQSPPQRPARLFQGVGAPNDAAVFAGLVLVLVVAKHRLPDHIDSGTPAATKDESGTRHQGTSQYILLLGHLCLRSEHQLHVRLLLLLRRRPRGTPRCRNFKLLGTPCHTVLARSTLDSADRERDGELQAGLQVARQVHDEIAGVVANLRFKGRERHLHRDGPVVGPRALQNEVLSRAQLDLLAKAQRQLIILERDPVDLRTAVLAWTSGRLRRPRDGRRHRPCDGRGHHRRQIIGGPEATRMHDDAKGGAGIRGVVDDPARGIEVHGQLANFLLEHGQQFRIEPHGVLHERLRVEACREARQQFVLNRDLLVLTARGGRGDVGFDLLDVAEGSSLPLDRVFPGSSEDQDVHTSRSTSFCDQFPLHDHGRRIGYPSLPLEADHKSGVRIHQLQATPGSGRRCAQPRRRT
mmetsp:Transcript_162797/g.521843  ORF Transcript_162797/g.521843 Transcript_162797/m.521843 type:complete len:492 (-) Transcript_162797:209-1684(-)